MKYDRKFQCFSIEHFRWTADQVEKAIAEEGFTSDDLPWATLKTVSHFNLGTSLELMLKLTLHLSGRPVKPIHTLAELYGDLLEPEQRRLETLFRKTCQGKSLRLTILVNDHIEQGIKPTHQTIQSLLELLEFLDSRKVLEAKRYSYEQITEPGVLYYIDDISAITEFINKCVDAIWRNDDDPLEAMARFIVRR